MKLSNDVLVKRIKTKNKIRRIVTYKSAECELRKVHNSIFEYLNINFTNSIFAKAYIKNRSIYSNAKAHMYNDYFIMLDVKDFFNNINHAKLIKRLYFELNNKANKKSISKLECADIVNKCSVSAKGIPLGFITSPILSNIYLKEFDGILYGKLKQFKEYNVIYTRYADDLTISFKNTANKEEIKNIIIDIVENLLKHFCLKLNYKKIRSFDLDISNHVKITGINIIKDKNNYRQLSVGKKAKNKLFWDAVECYKNGIKSYSDIEKIKGMQSFILSVEKKGFEECYSENMKKIITDAGFKSLKQLIDSLYYEQDKFKKT